MRFTEKVQEEIAKHLALAIVGLVLFALGAIWALPNWLPLGTVTEWLDWHATGKNLLRLILLAVGLAAWVVYLTPWLRFDKRLGIYRDTWSGLYYCTKCKTAKRLTPLREMPKGWHCVTCSWIYNNPDYKEPPKPKQDPEPHGWMRI